ncbi:hypothetical protein TNCV_1560591 [Trichonephila clavipes]|nr:hypothetical protein TNCV_1560591 [Trichonephila clavipes]
MRCTLNRLISPEQARIKAKPSIIQSHSSPHHAVCFSHLGSGGSYSPENDCTLFKTFKCEQWAEMIKKYGAIENAAIDSMFQCMDFLTAYKNIYCRGPIKNTFPSLDVSLGQQYLMQILKKSICSLLNEKGFKQPQTFAEEL